MAICGTGLVSWCGCSRDVRLAGRKLRDVTVRTVTHYGVTLDQNASPQQVAYVLLRAMRDDFTAEGQAAREAALDTQFDLCAANRIEVSNPTPASRKEAVYNVVYHWTPTVSHYAGDFETEWDRAQKRFALKGPRAAKVAEDGAMDCEVLMEVDDPGGDPNARVVMVIYLAQDSGFWRVLHLGFDQTKRSIGD